MRIGFMVRNLNERGGIKNYTQSVIENMVKLSTGNEFVIIYNDEKFLGQYSSYSNIKEVVVKGNNKLIWDQIKVPRILKQEKVDLIYNPKLSIPLFTKSKKVLMIHGAEQFAVSSAFPWYDRIYVRIFMPLYAIFADKIITTTKLGIEDLAKYLFFIRKNKFTYVYEGISKRFKVIDEFEADKIKTEYELPDKFILFIGGLTPLKNFSRAIRAFDILADEFDCHLVVVGFKKFKYVNDLEEIKKIKNKDKIKFCGFIPDDALPAFYNLADLYLFPSLYEGFGLPVLEAFASGCPVVTSKTGCTREVAGGAAVLADPYSVSDIAEKMKLVLTNSKLRDELIKNGFERVKNFSWEKTALETLKVFNSI